MFCGPLHLQPIVILRPFFGRSIQADGNQDRHGINPSCKRKVAATGGQVTCRQRPGTANGTMLLTLEDETGLANIIVPRDTVQEYWATACNPPYLKIEGVVEKDGGVVHLCSSHGKTNIPPYCEFGDGPVGFSLTVHRHK